LPKTGHYLRGGVIRGDESFIFVAAFVLPRLRQAAERYRQV